jgi:hypothetical protein
MAVIDMRHCSGVVCTLLSTASRASARLRTGKLSPGGDDHPYLARHLAGLHSPGCNDLLRLRRASGCLGTSRGSSRGLSRRSSSTTPPRPGSSSTTSSSPRVRVPRHVARLVTRLVAPLVVDYSASPRFVTAISLSSVAPAATPVGSASAVVRHRDLPPSL